MIPGKSNAPPKKKEGKSKSGKKKKSKSSKLEQSGKKSSKDSAVDDEGEVTMEENTYTLEEGGNVDGTVEGASMMDNVVNQILKNNEDAINGMKKHIVDWERGPVANRELATGPLSESTI